MSVWRAEFWYTHCLGSFQLPSHFPSCLNGIRTLVATVLNSPLQVNAPLSKSHAPPRPSWSALCLFHSHYTVGAKMNVHLHGRRAVSV
ncbi:hypothetical protein C8R44DRAFT_803242 [Mycena epipterygia]|nr:hypothetical protein C8R44DRAFT_803242 [Mycena epipterygia]